MRIHNDSAHDLVLEYADGVFALLSPGMWFEPYSLVGPHLKIRVGGTMDRPATRVGRELIFEGGECRRMGLVEYALVKFGIKRTVARRGQKVRP